MGDDEGVEVLAVAAPGEVAGDAAGVDAVHGQEEKAADAEEEAAGEALEGDADVVADVEAEHQPVGRRIAAADRVRAVAVHAVVHVDRAGVVDREDERRIEVGQQAGHEERPGEDHGGDQHVPAVGPHGGREVDQEQAAERQGAEVGLLVDALVGERRQPAEPLDQPDRVGAGLSGGEVLAGQPVEPGVRALPTR